MKKIKQHTIPKCYLEQFTNRYGLLHVLDLNKRRIFSSKPENIFIDTHFYTIKFPDSGGSLVVEDTLASIESEYSKIFHNSIQNKQPLLLKDRALISIFVAAMMLRTRAFRSNLATFFKQSIELIDKFEGIADEKKALFPPILQPSSPRGTISGARFREIAKDVPSFHSTSIIEMLPETSNIIYNMKWGYLIYEEKDDYFITSDNPCVLMNVPAIKRYGPRAISSSPGLLQEEVDLTLPLSSNITLLAGWKLKREAYISVPNIMVKEINSRVARHAEEKLIACAPNRLEAMLTRLKARE